MAIDELSRRYRNRLGDLLPAIESRGSRSVAAALRASPRSDDAPFGLEGSESSARFGFGFLADWARGVAARRSQTTQPAKRDDQSVVLAGLRTTRAATKSLESPPHVYDAVRALGTLRRGMDALADTELAGLMPASYVDHLRNTWERKAAFWAKHVIDEILHSGVRLGNQSSPRRQLLPELGKSELLLRYRAYQRPLDDDEKEALASIVELRACLVSLVDADGRLQTATITRAAELSMGLWTLTARSVSLFEEGDDDETVRAREEANPHDVIAHCMGHTRWLAECIEAYPELTIPTALTDS